MNFDQAPKLKFVEQGTPVLFNKGVTAKSRFPGGFAAAPDYAVWFREVSFLVDD